jgi:hypothetical protein
MGNRQYTQRHVINKALRNKINETKRSKAIPVTGREGI